MAVSGGVVYRSTDNAQTWTACSGGLLTPGVWTNMNQNGSFLYLTNGTDTMLRYDGTTSLASYTPLTTPVAPVVAIAAGLAGTPAFTYYYKVSAVNQIGFTVASANGSIEIDRPRTQWDASNSLSITAPSYQSGQTRFDIYISTDDITYNYLASINNPNLVYVDQGQDIVNPAILAPTGNTTTGPLVAELVNVGSRQFGVRDTDNPYRIWFTGGGSFSGAFSSAYDGGYIEWQTGGKYRPVKVADYRDGKGTPLATVWCSSADGQGCIIQVSLDTLTIGDISITVPSAFQLPGSRGTPSPRSVINVLNDYLFYNSQAYYNLGNARNMPVPILSTEEYSANIRPSVRQVNTAVEDDIAGVYYFARVYMSMPVNGATENNVTMVYDTERKAWLPEAFTLGFTKFLRYTDTNDMQHLLALKPGDPVLSEISDDIRGDYGQPFETILQTGLYPTTKDRFDFQFIEEGEVELSNPQDTVTVELLGTERAHGFETIKSKDINIEASLTNVGWDTFTWDYPSTWDNTSTVAETFSESSIKRYFIVQKEVNNAQWRITTNSLNAHYILRSLQTWGTDTQAGHPRQWRLN